MMLITFAGKRRVKTYTAAGFYPIQTFQTEIVTGYLRLKYG